MWKFHNIEVFFDITTRCNAGCPQCHRTDLFNVSKKASWLPDVVWSVNNFKKAVPPKVAKHIKRADICGTWGDPIANNDLPKIVEYLVKENSLIQIDVNTNGSLRNDDWWWKLGCAGGKNLSVIFAVEGINQKMHEHYRQNTFLDKILNNMDILSNTPAKVKTLCLVWKHNEKYLKEIEKMCIRHGSIEHVLKVTERFDTGIPDAPKKSDKLEFYNKGEKKVLERTSWKKTEESGVFRSVRQMYYLDSKFLSHDRKKEISNLNKLKKRMDITCEWGNKNKVVINPDGQVWPCCYFCNPTYKNSNDGTKGEYRTSFSSNPVMKEYENNKRELNIFHNSLDKILNNKWFKETLPNSWESKKPVNACVRFCGKKSMLR